MSVIRQVKKIKSSRARRFFSRFLKSTDASETDGNLVELLSDGERFFASLFASLRAAEHSICLECYIIRDDATGRELADILVEAAGRGVGVWVMYDYIGCFDTPSSYFRNLQQKGVKCLPFNPPSFRRGILWFDRRDHRKVVVIDCATAYAGGLNVGSEYAGGKVAGSRWRDMGMAVTGRAAVELQKMFNESWHSESGEDRPSLPDPASGGRSTDRGDATVHIVSGGPHHNRSHIHNAFRMAIGRANRCITVANPYFIPGPRLSRSLLRSARRGVKVRLILPAINDVPLVRVVSRSYYSLLLKGGIEIFEREGTVLHAKVMVIDSVWSIIGSANLDQRSFHRNYEVNLVVDSLEFGRQVESMLEGDLSLSRKIELDDHEKRGWISRLLERVASPLSWFL